MNRSELVQIMTVSEMQKDLGELLDYLHNTPENKWDYQYIRNKTFETKFRFDRNLRFYKTPASTEEYLDLVYSQSDMNNLIGALTKRYTAVGKLTLQEKYIGVFSR